MLQCVEDWRLTCQGCGWSSQQNHSCKGKGNPLFVPIHLLCPRWSMADKLWHWNSSAILEEYQHPLLDLLVLAVRMCLHSTFGKFNDKAKRAETKIGLVLRGLKVWRFMDSTTFHDNRKPRGHHEKCERRREIQHLPFPFFPWFWFLRWHTKDKWNQQDQISCRWEQLQKQLLSVLNSCKILNTLYIESQENELIIMVLWNHCDCREKNQWDCRQTSQELCEGNQNLRSSQTKTST